MRKRIIEAEPSCPAVRSEWLDLEKLAEVQVTSELGTHPIEAALMPGDGDGWKAAVPGVQTIRVVFDDPQVLEMVRLIFVEESEARTQEFVLRWTSGEGEPMTQIVRQQYHFTPIASEVENYTVRLSGVKILELEITPAIGGGGIASLLEMRLR